MSDQESNNSSIDSISNVTNTKYRKKLLKKRKDNSMLDTFSDSEDEYNKAEEIKNHSSCDDGDDRTETFNKSKLKKIKEGGKKCRLVFQVIRKRRECNSNYDSGEDLDVRLFLKKIFLFLGFTCLN